MAVYNYRHLLYQVHKALMENTQVFLSSTTELAPDALIEREKGKKQSVQFGLGQTSEMTLLLSILRLYAMIMIAAGDRGLEQYHAPTGGIMIHVPDKFAQ